jgi:GNAT superfamily N-acetyltransferase
VNPFLPPYKVVCGPKCFFTVRLDRDDVGNEIGLFSTTYVTPEFRNRAVAKQLLHHGESWIKERGMTEAATYTSDSNTKLINLYEGHGYQIAAKYPEKKMIKLAKALPPIPPLTCRLTGRQWTDPHLQAQ